jgi:hypothetical protein
MPDQLVDRKAWCQNLDIFLDFVHHVVVRGIELSIVKRMNSTVGFEGNQPQTPNIGKPRKLLVHVFFENYLGRPVERSPCQFLVAKSSHRHSKIGNLVHSVLKNNIFGLYIPVNDLLGMDLQKSLRKVAQQMEKVLLHQLILLVQLISQ